MEVKEIVEEETTVGGNRNGNGRNGRNGGGRSSRNGGGNRDN